MLALMQILRGVMAILLLVVSVTVLINYIWGAYVSDALAFLALMFMTDVVREVTENMEANEQG